MTEYRGGLREDGRVRQLMKRREKQKEEIEKKKQKIESDVKFASIGTKFSSHYDAVEQQLKCSTVGLVTLDEMKAKREDLIKEREKELAKAEPKKFGDSSKKDKKKHKSKTKGNVTLSFAMDDEEEDEDHEEFEVKKKGVGKNPDVDTSFLPDRDREEEENKLREELRQEWETKQEKIKQEEIEITYSYWDGSGHRRQTKMKKGDTMQRFLMKCLENLKKEFSELRACTVEALMYVKEDLILPHHATFYDFIVTKARGKSGPLFNFDVHEDIRLVSDSRVEKDESHAGKVVLRSWYERNKHIFPASRWEIYDPEKKWDKYTIK
ncbi:protein FAM50A-like [Anneissia japonica]|uniref:protein FAM50A-like n=1 Tax=Anneissia japonica TaxID=1529436 RepID=UPI001425A5BB|nr:protein FAM50A-like [Anneissia japonica]